MSESNKTNTDGSQTLASMAVRQDSIESEVRTLLRQMTTVETSITSLDTLVHGMRDHFLSVANDVKAINTKKFDWSTLFVGLGLVFALWAAAIKPIESRLDSAEQNQDDVVISLIEAAETKGYQMANIQRHEKELEVLKAETLATTRTRFTKQDGEQLRGLLQAQDDKLRAELMADIKRINDILLADRSDK